MGISLNVDVKNENEFNQQLQLYLAQGYNMQSNFNGTAILKKKSYSTAVLIVLIILFFPAAIIYYLVASDDVVTIRNTNVAQSGSTTSNVGTTTESFDSYCEECGHGLFKDSKFCPGCGKNLTVTEEPAQTVAEVPAETVAEEAETVEEAEAIKCNNCGTELYEEMRFCPECGEDQTTSEE